MKKSIYIFIIMLFGAVIVSAQPSVVEITYKTTDATQLKMKIYYPADYKKGAKYPAIIFFFGGGWAEGTMDQFKNQALFFASKGMIAITPDYRVKSRQGTTPFESVKDGRSAIRYLRGHSAALGIDPDKIAAAGGSAGGHIAAAADLTQIDEATDDLHINARPDLLALFNPVLNNGPGNYGYDLFKDRFREISPFHNIKKGAAPAIIFLGTRDKLVPVAIAKQYQQKMQEVGSRCDLLLYEGQGHGFFNYNRGSKYYNETLEQLTRFLKEFGYIK
ncbi:hypothetical protein A8C56_20670 [Niabella ginsenosidivorans]|uniref:Peptidase S9 n=2 Tax=Niabella ginsenosidivorans TaxID=1176587 RepID=A0A1A9I961_9BACT|nr:hypothetical protein A8C56_20670 [Niabella ginsenosidivorans]